MYLTTRPRDLPALPARHAAWQVGYKIILICPSGSAAIFEVSRESSERERCSQRANAVADEAEPIDAELQPVGHPISHSTKAGFKRRREVRRGFEEDGPAGIGGAWGEER